MFSDLATTFYPAFGKGTEMALLVSALHGTRLSYSFKDLMHAGTIAVLTLAVAMTMANSGYLDGSTSRIVNALAILFFVVFFMIRHLMMHIRMGELDESRVGTMELKKHVETVLRTFHVFPLVPDWVNYIEVTFCAIMFGMFVTISTHLM